MFYVSRLNGMMGLYHIIYNSVTELGTAFSVLYVLFENQFEGDNQMLGDKNPLSIVSRCAVFIDWYSKFNHALMGILSSYSYMVFVALYHSHISIVLKQVAWWVGKFPKQFYETEKVSFKSNGRCVICTIWTFSTHTLSTLTSCHYEYIDWKRILSFTWV